MDATTILSKLPEKARGIIQIKEKKDHYHVTHPYIEDKELFNEICGVVKELGGEVGSYYGGAAHYKIPKPAGSEPASVTPHVVSMDTQSTEEIGVKLVRVESLRQSPFWTRELNVETESFKELVESVKKNGVVQNLLARWKNNNLEIVIGHRRWLAARKAGLRMVPTKIRDLTDEQVLLIQFDENERREDLTDMEKAHSLQRMMEKFDCTQEELGKKIGKTQGWVSQHLAMQKIPEEFITRVITKGEFTEKQAREVLAAPEEKREEILAEIEEKTEEEDKIPSSREIKRIVKPRPCAKCNLASSDVTEWNNHGIFLCPGCTEKANLRPELFLKIGKKIEAPTKTIKPVVKDTWEHRKATMHPQHSKMELDLHEKLMVTEETRPALMDKQFCLKTTTPDFYFPKKKLAVYLDGVVHQGKEDRDQKLRTLLTKRHDIKVLSIPYTSNSLKEQERVFGLIKEALA